MNLFAVALVFVAALRRTTSEQVSGSLRQRRTTSSAGLPPCKVFVLDYMMLDNSDYKEERVCKFNGNGKHFLIVGVDDQYFETHHIDSNTHQLNLDKNKIKIIEPEDGRPFIEIQAGGIISVEPLSHGRRAEAEVGPSISANLKIDGIESFPDRNLQPGMLSSHGRARSLLTGTRSVLLVKVIDNGNRQVSRSNAEIAADWFSDEENMAKRYDECSGGKLTFEPAQGTLPSGETIVNGIVEVEIQTRSVERQPAEIVETWITDKVGELTQFDHVIYLLPTTCVFKQNSAAYAYIGDNLAVFWEPYIMDLQPLVHELGHNLGKRHSGSFDLTTGAADFYGDDTCMMGAVKWDDNSPVMCFNAPKSWYFGWYADRHAHIDPRSTFYSGNLVGIDEYVNDRIPKSATDFNVIVRAGEDLFIMFNQKKGVNREVQGHADKVTITYQISEGKISWQLGALDEGEEFRMAGAYGTSHDLVVRVCKKVIGGSLDYANVLLYLDGVSYPNGTPACSQQKNWAYSTGGGSSQTSSASGSGQTANTGTGTTSASARGDPHFITWSGEKYDFHGVCDLVLLDNPSYASNLGMRIHIRTKKTRLWSYISGAVVSIGEESLEVIGGSKDENHYWINKVEGQEAPTETGLVLETRISGYPIMYKQTNEKSQEFLIMLDDDGEAIEIKTWNAMVSVNILNAKYADFGQSLGLLGSFDKGLKVSRDNSTTFDIMNEFGLDWQVKADELKLFHTNEGPQAPIKCEIPSNIEMRRRLSNSQISHLDAEIACSRVSQSDFELCVFDVMATNDKDVAGAY